MAEWAMPTYRGVHVQGRDPTGPVDPWPGRRGHPRPARNQLSPSRARDGADTAKSALREARAPGSMLPPRNSLAMRRSAGGKQIATHDHGVDASCRRTLSKSLNERGRGQRFIARHGSRVPAASSSAADVRGLAMIARRLSATSAKSLATRRGRATYPVPWETHECFDAGTQWAQPDMRCVSSRVRSRVPHRVTVRKFEDRRTNGPLRGVERQPKMLSAAPRRRSETVVEGTDSGFFLSGTGWRSGTK